MSLGKWFAGLIFGLGCCVAAQAQLGAYGMYTGTRFTGIQCFDPQGQCSSANGNVSPSGGWGGVFYNFKTYGPVRLGADVRAGALHANKSAVDNSGGSGITTAHSVLGGVRGSVRTPIPWIKPYAQVSVGWTRSNLTEVNHSNYDNFLQYEGFVGADVQVLPFLDLRAVELGIGGMSRLGTGTGTSSVGVKSIGIGVVVHLPTP